MLYVTPAEVRFSVTSRTDYGEILTEFFPRQAEALAFAESCAEEGMDSFVYQLIRTHRAKPV